jgi:hypothetical protein
MEKDEFIRVVVVLPELGKDYELIGDVLLVTEEYACRLVDEKLLEEPALKNREINHAATSQPFRDIYTLSQKIQGRH